MSQSTSSTGEQPNAYVESADWRKEIDELKKFLVAEAVPLRMIPPRGRPEYENLGDKIPLIMSKIRDLEKLQQDGLDDILRCRNQWQTALSDRTGQLGDLDNKVREQQSKLDEQVQRAGYIEAGLDKRQVDADRTFASTQANTDAAKLSLSGLAEQKTLLEKLKVELEAKERYQQSRTLALSKANQELDQAVASNEAEARRLARDREAVKTDHKNVRTWKAYNDDKVAKAEARSQEAVEAKEILSNEIEDLKVQFRLLEQQSAKESRSLRIVTEANQELKQQLHDSQESNGELERGMRNTHIAILPQKEKEINSLKAKLDNVKEQAGKSRKDLTDRIGYLEKRLRGLEDNIRQKDTELNQLRQDNASLQAYAKQYNSEANSMKKELEGAHHTIESLNTTREDNLLLQTKNDELQAVVNMCKSEHSDIDQVRKQIQQLRIENAEYRPAKEDFAKAKSLQEASRSEYKKLEQECNEAKQNYDELKEQRDMDLEMLDTEGLRKDEVIQDLRDKYSSVESERDKSANDYMEIIARYNTLAHNANLGVQEKDDANEMVLRHEGTIQSLRTQIENLTAQLQSLQRSDKPASRKRSHGQIDSGEEQGSSLNHAERMVRRLGTAPELGADASAAGRSIAGDPIEDSASQGRQGLEEQGSTTESNAGDYSGGLQANADPSSVGPLPNIGQPRQPLVLEYGTKWRIEDVLNAHSSPSIPQKVLRKLRAQIRDWDRRRANWRAGSVDRLPKCAESFASRHGTQWVNGDDRRACASCTSQKLLCVAVSNHRIEILPVSNSHDSRLGIADMGYWWNQD